MVVEVLEPKENTKILTSIKYTLCTNNGIKEYGIYSYIDIVK